MESALSPRACLSPSVSHSPSVLLRFPMVILILSYSQTLIASGGGGSYTWSIVSGSLPAGLSLSPGGVISGTPATAGAYSFTVQVSDGVSTATQSLSITITSAIGIGPITWV